MTHERLAGNPFQLGMFRERNYEAADNLPQHYGSSWYFSRKEIEDFSPSRKDGIDLKKESGLRMCYCLFLKDFGMRLGVPQVTIATAIMFCHRFYLHQSHTKNDWQTVATVCIFLASKVEDTPLSLDKVVITAYETIYRKDPATARRIHQKDIFEKQKALIIIGERLLLSTIRFDFNIQHPYKPLLHALKKFGMAQKEIRQVAWNFVNDSLRTTLCLQYKPHYIAAGSVFLAAKLHNVKLPSERGYVWWHEFDVTPQQLHAAIQEMMELFGYKRRPVVTRALDKPTQTPSGRKEEASSSPDSCVLSRPGSSLSRSNQCSDGIAGIKKPVDLVPSNSNVDGKHACVTGMTEQQCQARDSESPDSVIEDCQVSGEDSGKTGTNPKQVVDIEDCQGSGDAVDKARMKSEQVADVINHEGPCEGVDQASTRPEQVANVEDCQGSGECVEEARMKSEQVADVISHEGYTEGVDQASTRPEQVANTEDCQGSGECVDQARTMPQQVAYIEGCQGSEEVEARKILEKIASIEDHQGSDVGQGQAASYLEKAIVINPLTNPEQVVIIKECQESGKGMGQMRRKLERVADSLSKVDMDRIKGMMKKRKRERENSKRTEVLHDSIEDAWIERELETGIELTAKSSEKKPRLA